MTAALKIGSTSALVLACMLLITGLPGMSPLAAQDTQSEVATKAEAGIIAQISGTSFLTEDAAASAAFYVKYLGFTILRDRMTDSDATKGVYGITETGPIRTITVVPAIWSREDPNYIGIQFTQISAANDHPFPSRPDRRPRLGEPTLGLQVNDLEAIIARMEADDITVVVPIAPSATGRSMAATVLDPNGIRIQLYEYIG
ncbi:VOC family protein [Erythrobacter sp. W53]|uniref:VOC family protein n=1 Tax=Erythrobacter sp. W53 TaxID=3425947 RepID=UPI003D766795